MMNFTKKALLGFVAAAGMMTMTVQGAGFAILEQTSAGLGRGLSGMAADIENPGALFFNPAVGAWHEKAVLSVGNSLMHVDALMDLREDSTAIGHDGGNGGGWENIPHLYYIQPLGDGLSFGLGFSATSGTATKWHKRWAGRYAAIDTEISVIDVTPTLSYKVLDNLSIALGIDIEYCEAMLSRAVPVPGTIDGKIKFKGDSIALGFTVGAMYEPLKGTRVGLGYRSRMTHELELEGKMMAARRQFKGDADCDLNLPGVLDFSVQQDLNEKWTVMGDIAWTHSSVMEDMTVHFKNDALGQTIRGMTGSNKESVNMSWRDDWRFALGTEYKCTDDLKLRFGVAYDQTPVKDKEHRVATLPDLSRVWVCAGFSYQLTESIALDFGYVHIEFLTGDMVTRLNTGATLHTKVQGGVDIFSTALTFTF